MATKNQKSYVATAIKIRFVIVSVFLTMSCASKFSGHIENQDSLGFQEARVNVVGLKNSYKNILTVDTDGDFSIPNDIPDGSYLMEVVYPGYHVFSRKINIKGEKYVRIHLSPINLANKKLSRVQDYLDMSRASGVVSLTPPRM